MCDSSMLHIDIYEQDKEGERLLGKWCRTEDGTLRLNQEQSFSDEQLQCLTPESPSNCLRISVQML